MLRVRTLYAASAGVTAAYYTQYLAESPDDVPGVWTGDQATMLGLSGIVSTDALEAVLAGRDPITGTPLGRPLLDRVLADGRVVRAVAGFDATFSAPKSLSVLAALTGDRRYAEAHDVAVAAVTEYLERFGATTRVRATGGRLHLDTNGLTMAVFRQATSRLDDPQLHTHVVISGKVQTEDGRWLALDARSLKQHQRALGGLYQSVLRAEVGERLGLRFGEVVNGQAEIAGVPEELLEVFSKRAAQINTVMTARLAEFYAREGRDPSPFERAAIEREVAADTRGRKTGVDHTTLHARWLAEAAAVGVTPDSLVAMVRDAARDLADTPAPTVTTAGVITELSEKASAWHRMDVVRAICDLGPERPGIGGRRWVQALDHAADAVLDACVDLDPAEDRSSRRASDGRSVWIEPVANHHTSTLVLAQEQAILAFAADAATQPAVPSTTVEVADLDVVQADAAAAVAGHGPLTVVIGPAGAGKTTMLDAAVSDLSGHGRDVFGVAPTAKAAAVLARETGVEADTVAKLLHEWSRPDRVPEPRWRLAAGTTLIVDEAGVVSTPDLARLTILANEQRWRLVLVGDPRQLQAVGRGGLLPEIARIVTPIELDTIHRFTAPWEAAATLQLRHGDPTVLDTYQAHGRIQPGTLGEHLDTITVAWRTRRDAGETLAVTATTNDHARLINTHLQAARVTAGDLDPSRTAVVREGVGVMVGDVVATRRNLRDLRTDVGEMVRNRDRWTVTRIDDDGTLTLSKLGKPGIVDVPRDTARDTIELAYAVTEYGNQGDTHPAAIALVSPATSARGLYVAMTRGRHENLALVITDTHDPAEARDVLERILATERVDVPATVQRRTLAAAGTTTPEPPRPDTPARPDAMPPTVPPAPAPTAPVTPPVASPARSVRAVIPVWFAEARTTIVDEMNEALGSARAMVDDAHRRRAAITVAARRLELAQAACEPFDDRVTATRQTLDAAIRNRNTTADRAERARFLARRDAKTQLDVAQQAVAAARTSLADAEHAAEPARAERRVAAVALDRLERAHRDQGIIDSYNYDSRRAADLERKLAAVDRWHDWANGAPVRPSEIGRLYQELERGVQHDWLRDDPAARFADALKLWATDHDVVLPSPRSAQRGPEHYLGIEL